MYLISFRVEFRNHGSERRHLNFGQTVLNVVLEKENLLSYVSSLPAANSVMAHLDEGTVAGQEMLVHENEYMGRQGDEPSRLTLAGNQDTSAASVKHYIIIIDVSQVDRRLQNVMCKLPCNFVSFAHFCCNVCALCIDEKIVHRDILPLLNLIHM